MRWTAPRKIAPPLAAGRSFALVASAGRSRVDQLSLDHRLSLLEGEVAAGLVDVDLDRVAGREASFEDAACQRILDPLLDDALEGAGAVERVVSLVRDLLLRPFGQAEGEVAVCQALA